MCLAWSRDQAHLARRTRWSGGFLACELLPDVGLLQDMRGSSFSRAIELWSSTQTDQSPWAEWVHATYVRRFRRASSAGEFGEEGACCSRGPIACAVRFRACGRGIGAASGLDGRYDHSAQGASCRLPWSVHSAAFDVGWYRQPRQAKSLDISPEHWKGTRRGWLAAAAACLHRFELRPCCQLVAQSGVSHIVVGVAQCGGPVAALTCVLGGGRGACALGTVCAGFL